MKYLIQLFAFILTTIKLSQMNEEEPVIERNPFSNREPTKEEKIELLMEGVRPHDQYRGFSTEEEGEDGLYNMHELNNYFKHQKPFMPPQFFEYFYKQMRAEVKEHNGLLSIRYFPGLTEKQSAEFQSNLSDKEMLEIRTQRKDPQFRLSQELEELLEINDPDFFQNQFVKDVIEKDTDKQYLDEIKYFDSQVGLDQSKKGKDGFLNEYEMLNQVNFMTQTNDDYLYVATFKAYYQKNETFLQMEKLSQNHFLKLFDIFQNEQFEKQPEKWLKIQENLELRNKELEKEVMEQKNNKLREIENKELEKSNLPIDDENENNELNELNKLKEEDDL